MVLAITGGGRIDWWTFSDVFHVMIGVGCTASMIGLLLAVWGVSRRTFGVAWAVIAVLAWVAVSPHAIFGGVRPVYLLLAWSMSTLLAASIYLIVWSPRIKHLAAWSLAFIAAVAIVGLIHWQNPNRDRYINCNAVVDVNTPGYMSLDCSPGIAFLKSSKADTYLRTTNKATVRVRVWYPVSGCTYEHSFSEIGEIVEVDGISLVSP